jgi:hypothetical protein
MWSYIIVLKRVSLRQIGLGIGLDYVYAVPIVIMSENGGMFTKKKLMTLTRSFKSQENERRCAASTTPYPSTR